MLSSSIAQENLDSICIEENNKKRKNTPKTMKNMPKNTKINKNFAKNQTQDSELMLYIKVLLSASKTIPNIVGILDKLIEKRASTFIPTSTIYGSGDSTYSEINHLIDLSERKDKLLNLYALCNDLVSCLKDEDRKLAYLKWVKNRSAEEISERLGISERTVYRRCLSIINQLLFFAKKQNYTLEFIKYQVGDEPWLEEIYQKKKEEERANNRRAMANSKINKI